MMTLPVMREKLVLPGALDRFPVAEPRRWTRIANGC